MKRFQFVNGRWVKSQKIVKFPKHNFDPSNFLAPRENCNSGSMVAIQTPMPVRKDTETQTASNSGTTTLGPQSGINVNTIKVDATDSQQSLNRTSDHESTNESAEDSANKSKMSVDAAAENDQRNTESEDCVTSQVSRPTNLPAPLRLAKDAEGNLVDEAGDNRNLEGGSGHPPLERSKSQLSPPVDATDAHPLLMRGEDDGEQPLYNLYAVVVS